MGHSFVAAEIGRKVAPAEPIRTDPYGFRALILLRTVTEKGHASRRALFIWGQLQLVFVLP